MSQMQIADNIKEEIDAINTAQKAMEAKKLELRTFTLSGEEFIKDTSKCDRLLSEWSDTLMTLVEAIGRTFKAEGNFGFNPNGVFNGNGGFGQNQLESSDLTLTKGIVIIAGVIGSILLSYLAKAPWTIGAALILGVFVIAFLNSIVNTVKGWIEKKPDESTGLNALSNKISESISYMRNEHAKRCFRLKFKTPDPARIARHDPQEDKALFDYKQQVLETLPRIFMNRIDDISVECNGEAFRRKTVLYGYWRGSGNSQPQQQNPGLNQ